MGLWKNKFLHENDSVYKRPSPTVRPYLQKWWGLAWSPQNGKVRKGLAPSEIRVHYPTYVNWPRKMTLQALKIVPNYVLIFGGFYIMRELIVEDVKRVHVGHWD